MNYQNILNNDKKKVYMVLYLDYIIILFIVNLHILHL